MGDPNGMLPPMLPVAVAPPVGLNGCTWQLPMTSSFTMVPGVPMMPPPFPLAMLPLNDGMAAGGAVADADQMTTDSPISLDDGAKSSDDSSSTSATGSTMTPQESDVTDKAARLAEKVMKHNRNQCTPCFYFTFRDDGCRLGDDCEFCHLCTKKQCRQREKQRAKAVKRAHRENGMDVSVGQRSVSSKNVSAQVNLCAV